MTTFDETGPELPPEERGRPESGRHPVNTGHLVMGVAFLGLTLVWALVVLGPLELGDHEWLLPAPWLAAGAIGLAATVLRGRGLGHLRRAGGHLSGHLKGWH